jgi:hypothetical protein
VGLASSSGDVFKVIEISCFNKVCALLVINSLPKDNMFVVVLC